MRSRILVGVCLLSLSVSLTSATEYEYEHNEHPLEAQRGHSQEKRSGVRGLRFQRPRFALDDEEHEEASVQRELIWKGEDVLEAEFPWYVELYARNGGRNGERYCAGVMISGNTFVTTARCTYTLNGVRANPEESVAIIKREEVQRGKGIERSWNVVREHPDHVYPGLEWNVAVVTISGSELFPQQDIGDFVAPNGTSEVIGIGYGETMLGGGLSDKLKKSTFRILNQQATACKVPANKALFCADTVGRLTPESSDSKDSKEEPKCDFADPKLCPAPAPSPPPTVFVPDGDVDFCFGDEGAPLTRSDRQLYGLYLQGGNCNGLGPNPAILVRVAEARNWILDTACEIGNTRCVTSCFRGGVSAFAAGMAARVADVTSSAWSWMTSSGGEAMDAP